VRSASIHTRFPHHASRSLSFLTAPWQRLILDRQPRLLHRPTLQLRRLRKPRLLARSRCVRKRPSLGLHRRHRGRQHIRHRRALSDPQHTVRPRLCAVPWRRRATAQQRRAAPDSSPLYSVEQCFPVLASYPVSCRPGDNVSVGSNVVTVQAGACTISTPVFAIDPRTQSATAAGICPGESSFSKATAVLGRRQLARRPALRCLGRVLAKRRADGGVRGRLRYGHWARGGVLPAGVSSRSTMRSEH